MTSIMMVGLSSEILFSVLPLHIQYWCSYLKKPGNNNVDLVVHCTCLNWYQMKNIYSRWFDCRYIVGFFSDTINDTDIATNAGTEDLQLSILFVANNAGTEVLELNIASEESMELF